MDTSKHLRRMPERGQIAGVCAGLAEYFGVDVVLVRILFVILLFITDGAMFLAYIVLAVVMPSEKHPKKIKSAAAKVEGDHPVLTERINTLTAELKENGRADRMRQWFGTGLTILGAWLLLVQFYPGWFVLRWDYIWPVLLIIAGVLILTRRRNS